MVIELPTTVEGAMYSQALGARYYRSCYVPVLHLQQKQLINIVIIVVLLSCNRVCPSCISDEAGELGCNADGAQRLFRFGVVEVSKMWECLEFETGVLRIHSNFIGALAVFHLGVL